jgi:hypothetical protein
MNVKIATTLHQNWKWEVKEADIAIFTFVVELLQYILVVKDTFDPLLDLGMLNLFLVFNYVLNFFDHSCKSPGSELTSYILILLFLFSLNLVDLITKVFQVTNLRAFLVKRLKSHFG